MRLRVLVVALGLVLVPSSTAAAWDPFIAPDEDPAPSAAADPAPFVIPDGIYYVTDTYAGDVVTTLGDTTTYSTVTVHESPGTYARVVDVVGTGVPSGFDGIAFNGRATLSDGRQVSGTYYENFVLTPSGYVSVSIVFFQDDSEARARRPSPTPLPPPTALVATSRPTIAGEPAPSRTPVPSRTAIPSRSAVPSVRVGIALAPDGPILAAAEVLRGRSVAFWPRAFANGSPVRVRSWRLLSAPPDYIAAVSGADEPFIAEWLAMPAPDTTSELRFEITTDIAPALPQVTGISVAVRAPALID